MFKVLLAWREGKKKKEKTFDYNEKDLKMQENNFNNKLRK
jgi:hypothetical protein